MIFWEESYPFRRLFGKTAIRLSSVYRSEIYDFNNIGLAANQAVAKVSAIRLEDWQYVSEISPYIPDSHTFS